MPASLQAAEESKANSVGSVSGGKIWNPYATRGAKSSKNGLNFLKIMFYLTVVASLASCLFIVDLFPSDITPENISMQEFNGVRWYEVVLFLIALTFIITALAIRPETIMLFPLYLCLLLAPTMSLAVKSNYQDINAWAQQYGYKFSPFTINDFMFGPNAVKALNLQTGEQEFLTLTENNGNLAWEGMKKIQPEDFDAIGAENVDAPREVELDLTKDIIVDSESGIKYQLGNKDGVYVLELAEPEFSEAIPAE